MQPSEVAARIRAVPSESVIIDMSHMAVEPWPYQAQDIAWMLTQGHGIIGSEMGTGKTVLGIGAASYLKEHTDDWRGMVVVVPKMGGLLPQQWVDEIAKFAPHLHVVKGQGKDRHDRVQAYNEPWDVLVLNYEAARNDTEYLVRLFEARQPSILFCDEASAFRNSSTNTAAFIRQISRFFERRYAVTGTPVQVNLEDLHGICWAMGWDELVGTKTAFRRRYLVQNRVEFYVRGGQKRSKFVTVGYKNVDELRDLLLPWYIRRTLDEPEVGKRIPVVVPFVFRLPMRPEQVRLYNAIQDGILAELRGGELRVGYVDALAKFSRLSAIADGTQTYNHEAADHSAKSDWLMAALQGQLAGEKVLIFSRFVRSVRPLEARLRRAGIDYEVFLGGSHQTVTERSDAVTRFREDPNCRVLIATQAIEMGVNLQVARVLVFYSMLPNPKRMEQILGRIRRAGNPYANVAAITLLSEGTVEEGIYDAVIERNAVSDVFWGEESVLFERLGEERLVQLIRGYRPRAR